MWSSEVAGAWTLELGLWRQLKLGELVWWELEGVSCPVACERELRWSNGRVVLNPVLRGSFALASFLSLLFLSGISFTILSVFCPGKVIFLSFGYQKFLIYPHFAFFTWWENGSSYPRQRHAPETTPGWEDPTAP